jgi:flavorubredoxin
MNMAKISISYQSKYGNRKKAMEYLARILEEKGNEVSVFSMADTGPNQIPDSDIYVFSTSVHMGKPPRKTRGYVKKFKGNGRYALVVTHASEPEGHKYSPPQTIEMMTELIGSTGLTPASDPLLIRVVDMKGPLEEGWEDKVRGLAEILSP